MWQDCVSSLQSLRCLFSCSLTSGCVSLCSRSDPITVPRDNPDGLSPFLHRQDVFWRNWLQHQLPDVLFTVLNIIRISPACSQSLWMNTETLFCKLHWMVLSSGYLKWSTVCTITITIVHILDSDVCQSEITDIAPGNIRLQDIPIFDTV